MTELAHVVCLGSDPQLLGTRQAVLSRIWPTTAVDTIPGLLKLSFETSFQVVVLCHTLIEADFHESIAVLRRCCPEVGIVAVTQADQTASIEGVQHTTRGLDGPEALIQTVRSALTGAMEAGRSMAAFTQRCSARPHSE